MPGGWSVTDSSTEDFIRRSRIARRRAHRLAALKRWLPRIGALAVAVAIAAWSFLAGPLRHAIVATHARKLAQGQSTTVSPTATPGSTTSSTIALALRSYNVGDCVVWDQSPSLGARPTKVVPCEGAHLLEVVGMVNLPPGPYPTEAQWATFRSTYCTPLINRYLTYPIDTDGRFSVSALEQFPGPWAEGFRTMWCGIGSRPLNFGVVPADELVSFSGSAKGKDQTYLADPGTCLSAEPDGTLGSAVACSQPHTAEVTGSAPLHGLTAFPQSRAEWNAGVGAGCDTVTRAWDGGAVPPGVVSTSLQFGRSSWDAGRRVVDCIADRPDANGHLLPISGSLHRP